MFMDERYAAGAWMRRSGECSWTNGKFKAVVFCTQDQSAIIEMGKTSEYGQIGAHGCAGAAILKIGTNKIFNRVSQLNQAAVKKVLALREY